MKAEIKRKWLAALRSGEYIQGMGYLRDNSNNYCCLGVLCDLAAREGIGEWRGGVFDTTNNMDESYVSIDVDEWADLGSDDPVIDNPYPGRDWGYPTLAGLNDDGLTFRQIADIIDYLIPESGD